MAKVPLAKTAVFDKTAVFFLNNKFTQRSNPKAKFDVLMLDIFP